MYIFGGSNDPRASCSVLALYSSMKRWPKLCAQGIKHLGKPSESQILGLKLIYHTTSPFVPFLYFVYGNVYILQTDI